MMFGKMKIVSSTNLKFIIEEKFKANFFGYLIRSYPNFFFFELGGMGNFLLGLDTALGKRFGTRPLVICI